MITWCRPAVMILFDDYNIVVINMEETAPARFGGGHGQAFSIDAWR